MEDQPHFRVLEINRGQENKGIGGVGSLGLQRRFFEFLKSESLSVHLIEILLLTD